MSQEGGEKPSRGASVGRCFIPFGIGPSAKHGRWNKPMEGEKGDKVQDRKELEQWFNKARREKEVAQSPL